MGAASTPPSQPASSVKEPAAGGSQASRPSSRAKPVSGAAIASAPPRAPLPTHPKPQPTAAATPAAAAAKPAPVALPRLSVPPVDKMAMAAVVSPSTPMEAPKISMTSKEWVIPPRPKPGRKPATDTPPTKRKAQNRAAQRAFRERRAARVGELEEQLDMQKEEYDKTEAGLKDKIHSLELDVQSFRSRCVLLENMLERERQERIRVETEAETLRRRNSEHGYRKESVNDYSSRSHDRRDSPSQHRPSITQNRLPHPETSRNFSISQMITPPDSIDAQAANPEVTCGNCSPEGRCACAEEVLATAASGCGKCGFGSSCQCLEDISHAVTQNQGNELKRPASPSSAASTEKRARISSRVVENETDFTSYFSQQHQKSAAGTPQASDLHPSAMMAQVPSLDTAPFKDNCGFCKEGTYCVCADAAMATPAMTPPDSGPVTRQTQTPPPSESDVVPPPLIMEMTADGAVKLPRRNQQRPTTTGQANKPAGKGCGSSGPGTCAQCQADPKSGLFCRLMAANFGRDGGGCCGGKGASGGCCKSTKPAPPAKEEKITLPSLPSLGLSCAEAYQTLASHRNFAKAADDIDSWLPKLKATPRPGPRPNPRGRMPIEVEAASIMSVLKEFDIRFGREC
ncbi:hypothetical protein K4F52_005538 [Lecanicillium sp. MT-2017a]|nr:hypothetical protein K4F52_005538 [Lecanicillium sp. MT-2017a]